MFALVLVPCAFAQKAPDSKTPDQRFADLVVSAAPMGLAKTSNGFSTTRDELATALALQAERERQTAQAAKVFYTQNPGHPKETEARKIEALCTLRGTSAGDTVKALAAIKLAKDFRERTDVPVKDRFEVALAADRLALTVKIKAKTAADATVERQLVGERLRVEFGDLSELHDYSMEIARRADFASAVKIATEVARSPNATANAKSRAQAILDRAMLVGRPVNLKLAKVDGGMFDLAQQRDKLTVVFVWSPSDPQGLELVKRFEKALPKDTQLVYVAFGGSAPLVNRLKPSASALGVHCHAVAGTASKAASDALKLRYADLPGLYVINRAGLLSAVGHVEEFAALMAQASR